MPDSFLPPAVLDLILNTAKWTPAFDEATPPLEAFNDLMAEATEAAGDMGAAMGASAGEVSAFSDAQLAAAEAAGDFAAAQGTLQAATAETQEAVASLADIQVAAGKDSDEYAAQLDVVAAAMQAQSGAAAELQAVQESLAAAAAAASDAARAAAEAQAEAEAQVQLASDAAAVSLDGYSASVLAAARAGGSLAAADARLAEAQQAYKDAASAAAEASKALADAQAAGGTETDAYTVAMDRSAAAIQAQAGALTELKAAQASAATATEAATAASKEAGTVAQESSARTSGGMKLWAAAAAAGVAISVKMAGDFQASMTRLVTSAGETQGNLGLVSQGILAMSSATDTSTSQLASGMYMVESAGFHGAAGLQVLKAAAEGAYAENASLSTVTNAVTSVLNAYGLKASDATAVTNEMLKTVGEGKMTFEQLASAISTVLPSAASLKISYAQVGGALATMTAMGVSAQEGTHLLAGTLGSLANPTSVMVNEMAQFGISSVKVQSQIGKEGLTGTIGELAETVARKMGPSGLIALNSFNQSAAAAQDATKMLSKLPPSIQGVAKAYLNGSASYTTWYAATKGLPLVARTMADEFASTAGKAHGFNSELTAGVPAVQTFNGAMAKMLGGQTGMNVALMLTGSHAKTVNADVAGIASTAKDAGANIANWALVQKNFNFQLGSAEKAVQAVAISFGTALLPAATSVMHALASFGGFLAKHTAASKALAIAVGVLLAGALAHGLAKALGTCVKGFQDVTGISGKVLGFFKSGEGEASGFSKMMGGIGSAASKAGSMASSAWSATMSGLSSAWSGITSAASSAGSAIASAWSSSMSAVASAASSAWSGVVSGLSTAGEAITGAAASVAEFASGVVARLGEAAAATGAWIAEHAIAAGTFIAENVAMAASATIAFIAENAATLGIVAGIALLVAGIIYLATHWKQVWHDICAIVDDAVSFVKSRWKLLVAILTGTELLLVIRDNWSKIEHFVLSVVDSVIGWVKSHWPLLAGILLGPIALAAALVYMHWREIEGIFERGVAAVISFLRQLPGRILSVFADAGTLLFDVGRSIAEGLLHGIESMGSSLISAGENMGSSLWHAAASAVGFGSPAKRFIEIGEMITAGLSLGISSTAQQAVDESRRLAQEVTAAAMSGAITASEEADLRRKLSAALATALKGGVQDALASGTVAQIGAAHIKMLKAIWDAAAGGDITRPQASSLAVWVKQDNTRLQALARQRTTIANEIAAAKAYAVSTASAATGTYDLSSAATSSAGNAQSVNGIISTLQGDVGAIRKFSANIKKLAKEGLNKGYLSQLIAMGPAQGGALAQELANANLGQIHSINAAEYQINHAAGQLGKQSAEEMYDSGAQAGKGFLSGLKAQQAAIEKVMAQIAASMVSRLRKDLGISSPSKVFFAHGQAVAQGLALGIASGIGQVARAVGGLSAAASLAGTRSTVPAGVLSAGGSQPVTVNLNNKIEAKLDGEVVWRQMQTKTLRYNIRNSGYVTGAVKPGAA